LRLGFSTGQSAERAGIFEQAVKREREAQRNKDGSKIAENFYGWVLGVGKEIFYFSFSSPKGILWSKIYR